MPRLAPPTYETMLQNILARLVTLSALSDVTDSSVLRHFAAAVARAVDQGNYQTLALLSVFSIDTASGSDLDARASEIGDIQRFAATSATGSVIFSRAATTGAVNIPQGTQVSDALGNVFSTQAQATITSESAVQIPGHDVGQDSSQTPILAVLAGSSGNVAAGTITSFLQRPPGVDSVVNISATQQGTDQETDDALRARLKGYIASLPRSTAQSLQTCVLGAQDPVTGDQIRFSALEEDYTAPGTVILYVDDGSGESESVATVNGQVVTSGLSGPPVNAAVGGETRLTLANFPVKDADSFVLTSTVRGTLSRGLSFTLHPPSGLLTFSPPLSPGEALQASYTYYTGVVALGQRIVDGDPTNPADYPGYRAAGISVNVLPPLVVAQPISVVLTVANGYDAQSVRTAAQNAILAYVNGLGIAQPILLASLFSQIMGVSGVTNCVITAPSGDVPVGSGQIARVLAGNVTVN